LLVPGYVTRLPVYTHGCCLVAGLRYTRYHSLRLRCLLLLRLRLPRLVYGCYVVLVTFTVTLYRLPLRLRCLHWFGCLYAPRAFGCYVGLRYTALPVTVTFAVGYRGYGYVTVVYVHRCWLHVYVAAVVAVWLHTFTVTVTFAFAFTVTARLLVYDFGYGYTVTLHVTRLVYAHHVRYTRLRYVYTFAFYVRPFVYHGCYGYGCWLVVYWVTFGYVLLLLRCTFTFTHGWICYTFVATPLHHVYGYVCSFTVVFTCGYTLHGYVG